MEDSHIANLDLGNGISFFGVYDGHGGNLIILIIIFLIGNEVAEFVRDHLVEEL